MLKKSCRLNINDNGIAHLVFDLPDDDNRLSSAVLQEFGALIDDLRKNSNVRALVISSAKENIFLAGPDIGEIAAIKDSEEGIKYSRRGQQVLNKLEALPFPSVAVIDGACFSAGLELALACTYRIASDKPKTLFGFPDSIAVFPGFGGTQRLPRAIGIEPAVRMLLDGKPLSGPEAYNIRLVDACFPAEFILDKTEDFVGAIFIKSDQDQIRSHRREPIIQYLLEKSPAGSIIFRLAGQEVWGKTKGSFPALLKVLEVIEKSCGLPLAEGLEVEAREWGNQITLKTTKNVLELLKTMRKLMKATGVKERIKPAVISSAGVIGAGGWGIAWCFTIADITTRLKDTGWGAVGKGTEQIYSHFKNVDRLKDAEITAHMHHLVGKIDYSAFEKADIVVEAVQENLEVKKKIYAELEKVLKDDAIIATTHTSPTITELSKDLKHPERFIGMNFCGSPVPDLAILIEVAPGEKTSAKTIATVVDLCKKFKNDQFIFNKIPLIVKDRPGFLVERIVFIMIAESFFLLQEGAKIEQIEEVMNKFGFILSLEMCDMVGFAVAYNVFRNLSKAYSPRIIVPKLLQMMYEDYHLLGKKGGKGFYLYDNKGDKKQINPEIDKIIVDYRRRMNIMPRFVSNEEILERLLLAPLNEAARCLEEKIIESPEDMDLVSVLIGIPASRGGLLHYADELGIKNVVDRLEKLSEVLGERYKPCNLLTRMAKRNLKFFPER
jgi:3-hydroxyacyl-CoA dehydrogenase/enoyl-CoA hydratase/3-hydroxybutyryl-CoA epimerase